MKKSNLFLSMLCIFFCFVASSCNLAEVFDVDETKNEWYYQPFEYQTDKGILYLESYLLYSDGDYKKPTSFRDDVEIKDGLTILVVPVVDRNEKSLVDLFFDTNNSYFMYNFPKGKKLSEADVVVNDTDEKDVKLDFKINDTTWSAIYLACLTGETDTPDALRKSSSLEEGWHVSAKEISIKKILASILLKYLEE